MAAPFSRMKDYTERLQLERRRQVRGLVLLAFGVLLFSILRAGVHHVFPAGWWRLW
ncbi:hypothetical protein [Edaphobacter albus]|uniref:hypothetical protein n=1 Tax=Edaphobacter sp. 4G125 TaxID=2763071 RepID=UPI0016459557|nr:hypothetical protein [Edaphobacter sp. 4G125]QNI37320.1 hypothetical protein H7846_03105 [Edaphobacter sp. 4G125]